MGWCAPAGDGAHHEESGEGGAGAPAARPVVQDRADPASLEPGASVSAIAPKRHHANLLLKWRREERRRPAGGRTHVLPVCVRPSTQLGEASSALVSAATSSRASRASVIELEIAGAQLRLRGGVDEAMLASVLRALRQST